MARLARVVVPGLPHRVTRRGDHREPVFVNDAAGAADLALIGKVARASDAEIRAWRLLPSPAHKPEPSKNPRRFIKPGST